MLVTQNVKLIIVNFSPCLLISVTLDLAILRHILFLKHLASLYFLNLRDEILPPHTTTGKVML